MSDRIFGATDGIYFNAWMQDVRGQIQRGNPAVCLRHISNAIVHIQVRALAVHSTRFDELTKPDNQFTELILIPAELGDFMLVVVLIVGDDVHDVIYDLLIVLRQLL